MQDVLQILCRTINIRGNKNILIQQSMQKTIIDKLKEEEVFHMLFSTAEMSGSYLDKLKISKANEFDILLLLEFFSKKFKNELNDRVEITADPVNKGNVFINLTSVLEHLNSIGEHKYYQILKQISDDQNYLLESKLHKYFQSWMSKLMDKINNKITVDGIEYGILYRRSGPAHTIVVTDKDSEQIFSTDFVPAIRISIQKCVVQNIPMKSTYWEAIPKPIDKEKRVENSFRASYSNIEKNLIKGKGQMKNNIKLIKKFRDRQNMTNLKSYYIKTLFMLCDIDKADDNYWNKIPFQILLEMFERLLDALNKKEIKHYWHRDLNMLEDYDQCQIRDMYNQVRKAQKILWNRKPKEVINLFLTANEQKNLTKDEIRTIADSLMEIGLLCYLITAGILF